MKKSKLSLGLVACLLSVGSLAGCEKRIKSTNDGVLLTYRIDGGEEQTVKADEILSEYYDDSSKYQAIYDTIYSIMVKNYFTKNREVGTLGHGAQAISKNLGLDQMTEDGGINDQAEQKVQDDEDTAKENAATNNTKEKKEWEAILANNGVKTREELKEKYVAQLQKETFEENFYKYFVNELKNGQTAAASELSYDNGTSKFWNGYFEQELPYHVSHILVKLEDGSGTNYANGTISEANAKKLYTVVQELIEGNKSFVNIAKQYSEDDGSGALGGDLGIMDLSTSFVNEFKLGVYAYEALYNGHIEESSKLMGFNEDEVANYKNAVGEGLPTLDVEIFEELNKYADKDKDGVDGDGESVIENASLVFPRNIIYNKYLNKHSIAFITGAAGDAIADPVNTTKTTGFIDYTVGAPTDPALCTEIQKCTKPILSVRTNGEWKPLLCVRGGSDYQGIHLIVVNRSAFNVNEQGDYYTTYSPDDTACYPVEADGVTPKDTYVNFSSTEQSKQKKRAEEFASKLKSFDSDRLGKYMFKRYMKLENLEITNPTLRNALDKWINTSIVKSVKDKEESWKKTWDGYVDALLTQKSERTKLVSEACKISYAYANEDSKTVDQVMVEFEGATVSLYNAMSIMFSRENVLGEVINGTSEKDGYLKNKDGSYKKVSDLYKKVKGVCNDGKAHL